MAHEMFRVEATLTPVPDEAGWVTLRSVLDTVPGTILVEDSDEPVLIFPVEAESAFRAVTFVDGLSKVVGFTIVSGTVGPALELDVEDDFFEDDDDESTSDETADTSVTRALQRWVDEIPAVPSRRDLLTA